MNLISSERKMLRINRAIWAKAQTIIAIALQPIIDAWAKEKTDAAPLRPWRDMFEARYPKTREKTDALTPSRLGPLSPTVTRMRTVASLSNAQLEKMWPGIRAEDVRLFAPWAWSHNEVARLAMPPYSTVTVSDLIPIVARSIAAAKANFAHLKTVPSGGPTGQRPPGAFQASWIRLKEPPPPVIFDRHGVPVGPPPPMPAKVTVNAIEAAQEWARVVLGEVVSSQNMSPILSSVGREVERGIERSETPRLLAISASKDIPGMSDVIDQWISDNVRLIETGVMAGKEDVKLRPSLLQDVFDVVRKAHDDGLRVESIAGILQERFGVSDSRAELIARDQTNKLAGQINRHRQVSSGITHYRWSTSRDERVRKTHRELDKTKQSWNSPPEVAPGRHEHPGGDFQCRCQAIALVEDL